MAVKIVIKPLGWLEEVADMLATPFMYLFSGNYFEISQKTHSWNNVKLSTKVTNELDLSQIAIVSSDDSAINHKNSFDIRFHLPMVGGWNKFVVIMPSNPNQEWFIGWASELHNGVSRIRLKGPVCMLKGPVSVKFFGIDVSSGWQISVEKVSEGKLGDRGDYSQIKLL